MNEVLLHKRVVKFLNTLNEDREIQSFGRYKALGKISNGKA